MLGGMDTRARGLPGGWSGSIGVAWLICVAVVAWLDGREENPSTSHNILTVVAIGLTLALGIATEMEGRKRWNFLAVPVAALLAVVATSMGYDSLPEADQYMNDPVFALAFPFYVIVFAALILAGVLVGKMWRRVSGRLAKRSTRGDGAQPPGDNLVGQ